MNPIERNISLYRWSRFLRNLMFWQAIWFLYFQDILSGAQAIMIYVIYDVATTVLEVPSGYMSDRLGRKITLMASAVAGCAAALLQGFGSTFLVFAIGQVLLGASMAFSSGTDEAMLYESLKAVGREDEIERQEIIAWRWSFSALALSAVVGGAMFMLDPRLPYWGVAVAFIALCIVTWRMVEPPRASDAAQGGEWVRLTNLGSAFRNPVLMWFFALTVLMYGFSHLPFVFGQPFILEALEGAGFAASAPLVSGAVTAAMMVISVVTSLFALGMRNALGLPVLLLGAFGLQIAISGVMALTDSAIVLAFLLLRMVPDALSRPFVLARIQPLLSDDNRATWLSLKSFAGRLMFAAALAMGAVSTTDAGTMPYEDIRKILIVAVVIGLVALTALALAARRIAVAQPKR